MDSLFLSPLFKLEELMDVTFTFPSYPKTTIKAHKLVLASWSPVFRAMFYGGLKEEKSVPLENIKPNDFQKMLSFLYGQPIDIEDITEAVSLYTLADKYDLPAMIEWIDQYFSSKANAENCCEIYDWATAFKLSGAIKSCENIFQTKTREVTESSSFLHSSPETVNKICCLEEITGTYELSVYKAIEKWVTVQSADDNDITGHLKKVEKAIQSVRFLSITSAEICKMSLLTYEQRIAIIYKQLCPNATDVTYPVSFSTHKTPRTV